MLCVELHDLFLYDKRIIIKECLKKEEKAMRFLKYLGRLLREFWGFAWQNKAWWIVPMILILLLMVFSTWNDIARLVVG